MTYIGDKKLELGKKSEYHSHYDASKLFPISRTSKRLELGLDPKQLPFRGFDLWNHYEVSWLNLKGKPIVAIAELIYDCLSPYIVESKSLKLYFNTLNNTRFASVNEVQSLIAKDLSQSIHADVLVTLRVLGQEQTPMRPTLEGECLDDLDIECNAYEVAPSSLSTTELEVEETLYSDLLKSNCLVTFQPDWGSVWIQYKGPKINREGLLHYIVSFRNHNEFHEQCVERIFSDILSFCRPNELTVYGRYTRRGGVDINPYRTTKSGPLCHFPNIRLPRQ